MLIAIHPTTYRSGGFLAHGVLKYFYFFKNREIAEKLNLSLKQVENRLARNKEKLKAKLLERGI